MKKTIDIYNYRKKLDSAVKMVKEAQISERNKQLILEFRDFASLDGLSLPRILRYLGVLKDWAKIMNVDFDKASKEDIVRAVRIIQENENYRPWTKATYKIMLKRFYKWLKKVEDSPEEVKWIKTTLKRTETEMLNNGDLITEDDVCFHKPGGGRNNI